MLLQRQKDMSTPLLPQGRFKVMRFHYVVTTDDIRRKNFEGAEGDGFHQRLLRDTLQGRNKRSRTDLTYVLSGARTDASQERYLFSFRKGDSELLVDPHFHWDDLHGVAWAGPINLVQLGI